MPEPSATSCGAVALGGRNSTKTSACRGDGLPSSLHVLPSKAKTPDGVPATSSFAPPLGAVRSPSAVICCEKGVGTLRSNCPSQRARLRTCGSSDAPPKDPPTYRSRFEVVGSVHTWRAGPLVLAGADDRYKACRAGSTGCQAPPSSRATRCSPGWGAVGTCVNWPPTKSCAPAPSPASKNSKARTRSVSSGNAVAPAGVQRATLRTPELAPDCGANEPARYAATPAASLRTRIRSTPPP